MDDDLRSMIAGPAPLYILAALALALTWRRRGYTQSRDDRDRLIDLVLLGIAAQCLHFTEEFVTGFHVRAPRVLGLVPWSSEFFVTFNLVWLAVWMVSLVGIRHRIQAAWFPGALSQAALMSQDRKSSSTVSHILRSIPSISSRVGQFAP
jgi:hypothetical protein